MKLRRLLGAGVRILCIASCFLAGALPVQAASDAALRTLIGKEVDRLAALYSDGFSTEARNLRHIASGPLFDTEQPAYVAFFVMQGVDLSNVHQEYIAIFAPGRGRDFSKRGGPKERAVHMIATALVGSRWTRTLDGKSAMVGAGEVKFRGLHWAPSDAGCCPSQPVNVTIRLSKDLITELRTDAYPVLTEHETPLERSGR